MSLNYCVFWYPTIFYAKLECAGDLQRKTETSDDTGLEHHITLTLDTSNHNLHVKSETDNKTIEATLEFIESSRNGLFLYSYKLDLRNEEAKFIVRSISNIIYHLAKDFYHVHELNHESDSTLEAYISKKKPNIKAIDNPALVHFLTLYEKKIIAYSKDIFHKNQHLAKIKADRGNTYLILKEKIYLLNVSCENAISEYVYCKTLLGSRYNHSCKVSATNLSPGEAEDKRKLRRAAANIHNAIRYIKYIKEKNWDYLSYSQTLLSIDFHKKTHEKQELTHELIVSNDELSKISKRLGWGSLILGCVSIVLALIPLFTSKAQIQSADMEGNVIKANEQTGTGLHAGSNNRDSIIMFQPNMLLDASAPKKELQLNKKTLLFELDSF